MKTIQFTKVKLDYGWLGNMAPYPVVYNGKIWKTTEALFQALRFNDETIREAIRAEKSPMGAKMRTKAIVNILKASGQLESKRTVEPMSSKDVENMELCLRLKIEQHPELKRLLAKTGNSIIIEDCTSRGKRGTNIFWGAVLEPNGTWCGESVLGNLWMKIRNSQA